MAEWMTWAGEWLDRLQLLAAAVLALVIWWRSARGSLEVARREGLMAMIPVAVAEVDELNRLYKAARGKSLPEKPAAMLDELRHLAAAGGIEIRPEDERWLQLVGRAEHRAQGAARAEAPPDPHRAPGSTSPAPGASSPSSTVAVLPGSP